MTSPIDLADVPSVSQGELALPMRLLIDAERALCLLKGAELEDRRVVEEAFWETFDGSTSRGSAILVRFWCLVDAFSGQRFKALLLHRGYMLIGPAVAACATLRLNAHWGFNPQRLLWGMQEMSDASLLSESSGLDGYCDAGASLAA